VSRELLIGGLLLALAGCALTRVPAQPWLEPGARLHPDRAAIWQVGVSEPVLHAGEDQPSGALHELDAAANLIWTLRRTDLFHEVDFTRQLRCPIDLELAAQLPVDDVQYGPLWLELLTLSLKTEERVVVSFHAVDAPQETIRLRYETGEWMGMGPLLLSPLAFFGATGDWRLDPPAGARTQAFRAQLLAHGGALEREAEKTQPHCRESS
jgi:hypothetical protein